MVEPPIQNCLDHLTSEVRLSPWSDVGAAFSDSDRFTDTDQGGGVRPTSDSDQLAWELESPGRRTGTGLS